MDPSSGCIRRHRCRATQGRRRIQIRRLLAVAAGAALATALSPALAHEDSAARGSIPQATMMIIGRMGVEMSEQAARHEIAFRPFTPPRRIVAVALLPAFHGDDVRKNRGIAFEYFDAAGRRYALAQWPANGGTIARFLPLDPAESGCESARSFPRGTRPYGIVWSTSHGLIVTLQADGVSDARTLGREWRKLIRRGICR